MKTTTQIIRAVVMALAVAAVLLPCASASAADEDDDGWRFRIAPYVWTPGADGEVTVGRRTVEVDYTVSDALEALTNIVGDDDGDGDDVGAVTDSGTDIDFAFLLLTEVGKGPWSVLVDLNYLNTTTSKVDPRLPQVGAELGFDALNVGGTMVRRLLRGGWGRVDVLGGVRYTDLEVDLDLRFPDERGLTVASIGQSWASPIIGARGRLHLPWRLFLQGYVDIGGAGLGADFTWQGFAAAGIGFRNIDILVGYRHLYNDYENEDEDFVWDVGNGGPIGGVSIHF